MKILNILLTKFNKSSTNKENNISDDEIKLIKQQILELPRYPVSPFFAQRVMNEYKISQREDFWVNLQLLPLPVIRYAIFTLVIIVFLLSAPFNHQILASKEVQQTDMVSILYNQDSFETEITTDDQALQYAMLH